MFPRSVSAISIFKPANAPRFQAGLSPIRSSLRKRIHHEEHEEKPHSGSFSILRALRVLRGDVVLQLGKVAWSAREDSIGKVEVLATRSASEK